LDAAIEAAIAREPVRGEQIRFPPRPTELVEVELQPSSVTIVLARPILNLQSDPWSRCSVSARMSIEGLLVETPESYAARADVGGFPPGFGVPVGADPVVVTRVLGSGTASVSATLDVDVDAERYAAHVLLDLSEATIGFPTTGGMDALLPALEPHLS